MSWKPDRYQELRDLVRGRNLDREVAEELESHIALRVEELVAQGMAPDAARAEALRRFGNLEAWCGETLRIDREEQVERRRGERLDALRRDLRLAWRSLRRTPGFALVAALTLALGIGANTAIFSVVDAVLLRPLPVHGLDRLVVIRDDIPALELRDADMSPAEAMDLMERRDLFTSLAAFASADRNLTGDGDPQRVKATVTIGPFFDVFGVRPMLGRLYRPEDSRNGNHRVAVLSHAFWREHTGGNAAVVGTTVRLNGVAYEVIGVLPPEFRYPHATQLWAPAAVTADDLTPEARGRLFMTTVGRLRPGVGMDQLQDQLAAEARRWRERYPSREYWTELRTIPFVEFLAGQLRPILLVLMGAVGLVLLIACANVASLQLVRATGRAREMAVRAALGSGRWPLVRQLLVESLVLGVLGGALGIVVGQLLLVLIARTDVAQFAILRDVRLDAPVLAFTAGVTVLAAMLFGTVPALRATDVRAGEALKESGGRGASAGPARARFLQGAVVVQVALALVLLLGSGVVARSLARLLDADPGFRAEQVATMQLSLSGERYRTIEGRNAFEDALLERLRATPGVQTAGTVFGLPFSTLDNSSPFEIIGRPRGANEPERHANMWFVGGDYFQAMGIPVLRGRAFTDADRAGTEPVVVIDEALARQYFPGEDPIGKRVAQGPEGTIVGVVGSVKKRDLSAPDKATIYYPFRQLGWPVGRMAVVTRGSLPSSAAFTAMRTAVRELDRDLPVFDVMTMQERVARSLGARRLAMWVLGGFAALALLLSALGVYGVLSYGVSQRTQEIGVRMALGAQPGQVVRMVLRGGVLLAGVGLALGATAFLGVGGALSALLYGVTPRDPVTLAAGVLVLAAVAVVGCWLPARRAARVEPVEALRG